MSSITCHTLGGFKGGFFIKHGRPPTEQEIFNAGMRSGRDIIWPRHMVNNPDNQEVTVIEKKLFDEMLLTFCAFAHPDRIKAIRVAMTEPEIKEESNTETVLHFVKPTPPDRPELRTQDAPLKRGGLLGFQLNVPIPKSYSRSVPTAIGGTYNRSGRNVYWQIAVGTLSSLPLVKAIGVKAFVADTESVYDSVDIGWVLNESDTAFIKGNT